MGVFLLNGYYGGSSPTVNIGTGLMGIENLFNEGP